MAGALYQILSGAASALQSSISTASLDGWVVFGGVTYNGTNLSVLMGKGTGEGIPISSEFTQSLGSAIPASPTGSGIWQNVYPPQTATDTSLGINTDPNKISVIQHQYQGFKLTPLVFEI